MFFPNLKLNTILVVSTISLIIIGGVYTKLRIVQYQRDTARTQLALLSTQVQQQNVAIQQWKKAADQQAKRLSAATQEAYKKRIIYKNDSNAILKQNVSSNCTEAVRWAAKMGSIL